MGQNKSKHADAVHSKGVASAAIGSLSEKLARVSLGENGTDSKAPTSLSTVAPPPVPSTSAASESSGKTGATAGKTTASVTALDALIASGTRTANGAGQADVLTLGGEVRSDEASPAGKTPPSPPPVPASGRSGPPAKNGAFATLTSQSDGPKASTAKSGAAVDADIGFDRDVHGDVHGDDGLALDAGQRRSAKRRPSGPVRRNVAANDDAPSIGGLIYALEQKPSGAPFKYAAIASIAWAVLGGGFAGLSIYGALEQGATLSAILLKPDMFFIFAAVAVPIAVIWFLAVLAWRSEELRLRSSTMTEVAIRLAEPDRMAEDSVVSLGQAVRRQVSFMNDAVSRALGRAGELEALVHNEVTALERSYEHNERKIRGLIEELSGERFELMDTSERIVKTLDHVGTRVPELLEQLGGQQQKLAQIIEGAGDNLEMLETSLSGRTEHLQTVLTDYTGALDTSLESRTEDIQTLLTDHSKVIDEKLVGEHEKLGETLEAQNARMQAVLEDYTMALATALGTRSEEMQLAFDANMKTLDSSIADRTESLQTVFEAYAQALDTTIAQRADSLNTKLVERTQALDDAFSDRLRLFDESVHRSTSAIDGAIGERAQALSNALESHAREFKETITLQAADLDESMAMGINAVRRSSENITRHSIKAIEGIAGQSDLLKNVSENLLTQINSVTNRFDAQGQTIMKAASALESANFKIDQTLQNRHAELAQTLDRMSGKAEEFGKFLEGYSSTIEGTLSEAEMRARAVADELKSGTESQQRIVLEDLERFRTETDSHSRQALDEGRQALDQVREQFSQVSNEVSTRLGSLTTHIDATSADVRRQAEAASQSVSQEQERLRAQMDALPKATEKSTEAMRRALQDQLRALEDLSRYTNREASLRDVQGPLSGPSGGSGSLGQSGQGPVSPSKPAGLVTGPTPSQNPVNERSLSTLSKNLAKEISERADAPRSQMSRAVEQARQSEAQAGGHGGAQHNAPSKQPSSTPAAQARTARPEGWSVGDLLKRASDGSNDGEDGGGGPSPSDNPFGVDLRQLAQGLSPERAMDVWNRLRSGQRGFMSANVYSPEGQKVFVDISQRHARDANLQQSITTYLSNFESSLRVSEQNDPSGAAVSQQLVSESGRVYLILAHASGRLN
ncbi:MAG: hypothetical protein AAFV45_12545 [Pseudomonadota bacterium]